MALLHRTRDRHIQQSPFFFDLKRLDRELRGEQVLFESDDEHHGKLQTLRCMHGHQRHALFGVLQVLVLIGLQTHLAQKIRDGRIVDAFVHTLIDELMNSVQQLLHVLRTVDSFLRAVQR